MMLDDSPKGNGMGRKRTRPVFKKPDLRQKFCLRLHDLVDQRGVTSDEIAAACGIGKAAVSRWFNGTAVPELHLWPTLAAFLGLKDYRDLLPPS